MKTPAKINASRDESGKMLIGLDGTGAGLLLLAGRIASGVLVTVASNEKELAELKNGKQFRGCRICIAVRISKEQNSDGRQGYAVCLCVDSCVPPV